MLILDEEAFREKYGDVYAIASESAVRPEEDQEVMAEIWRVLMERGNPPNYQTRMLTYLIHSKSKPERSYEQDGKRKIAFSPFIYDNQAKNFACRKFFESEADLLAWYSNKYGEPIESLTVTYEADGESNPLTEWDNRYVFITSPNGPYPEGHAQLVGILDGDFPELDLKKHAKPAKPVRHREEQLEM